MRTTLFLLSIIVMCGMASAEDTTATSAPAPATAIVPAPAVTPAPAPTAEPVVAPAAIPVPAPATEAVVVKPAVTTPVASVAPAATQRLAWSGLAMFRLRDEMYYNRLQNGKMEESATFSNQIAYKLGLKVNPCDRVLLQFELGNDWYATEEALGIPGNYYTKRNPLTPWFSLAYAQWDPGYLHVQAGIIPVRGTPLMDLLGMSLLFNRSYKMAAHIPWGVVTNFSQTGMRLGAPIVKGPVTVGLDAMSAIIEQRYIKIGLDTMKLNPCAVEFEVEAPISADALTLTPQLFIIPNRSYNKGNGKSDMEYGMGVDGGYKLEDGFTLRAGFGYARNSNKNSAAPNNMIYDMYYDPFSMFKVADTVNEMLDSAKFDRWGINLNVGATLKLGPGKLDVDLNLSNERDELDANVDDLYGFADVKYGWALEKNFILTPRIRFFITDPYAQRNGTKDLYDYKVTARPELILAGFF